MKKNSLDASYESYKRQYNEWEDKGYAMSERLSKKEYKKLYEDATSIGMKNIARTFAAEARESTHKEAAQISKAVREAYKWTTNEAGERVRKGFEVREKIDGNYVTVHIDLSDFDIDPADFSIKAIKARGLAESYNELVSAGLSEREAGSIIDEAYAD